MYRWASHVDDAHVRRVHDAFDALSAAVPGIRRHEHGSDVGVSEGTYDFLVVADFDSVAEWRAYRDHPEHVLLVAELIDGHVVEQASGHYQAPDDRDPHDLSAVRLDSFLAGPDTASDTGPHTAFDTAFDVGEESDDELLARARRAARVEMEALLAEPDDLV